MVSDNTHYLKWLIYLFENKVYFAFGNGYVQNKL